MISCCCPRELRRFRMLVCYLSSYFLSDRIRSALYPLPLLVGQAAPILVKYDFLLLPSRTTKISNAGLLFVIIFSFRSDQVGVVSAAAFGGPGRTDLGEV